MAEGGANPVGMSDAQLKQHINMLTQKRNVATPTSSPATFQSSFALPFQPANATWSPTPTRGPGRPRGGRASKAQTPVQQMPSPYPALPAPPPPPRPPIPTQQQALHTSYASRMRTGASLLVQPIIGIQTGAATFPGAGGGGGRSRRVVNYAEAGSGDDFDGGDGDTSDDSEQEQPVKRRPGRPRKDEQQPAADAKPTEPAKAELDQSYLGQVPPAKFVTSSFAKPTKHEY